MGQNAPPLLKQKFPTPSPLQGSCLAWKMLESNPVDDFTILSELYAKIL